MKKILIVEDDMPLAKMYQTKVVKEGGFEVVIADNGIKGLEMARKEKPDLILLDMIMPDLDGRAVFEALKKDSSVRDIPVIFLTNLGSESDVNKNLIPGAAAYLIKADCTPADVIKKIQEVLRIN